MTERDLMNYCWMRDFNYEELKHTAVVLNMEPPTEFEYGEYCEKENKAMDAWIHNVTGK